MHLQFYIKDVMLEIKEGVDRAKEAGIVTTYPIGVDFEVWVDMYGHVGWRSKDVGLVKVHIPWNRHFITGTTLIPEEKV